MGSSVECIVMSVMITLNTICSEIIVSDPNGDG